MTADSTTTAAKPYDEMHAPDGAVRPHYLAYADWLADTPRERIERKRSEADVAFHRVGITFNVYGAEGGKERLIPSTCCRGSFRARSGRRWRPACASALRRSTPSSPTSTTARRSCAPAACRPTRC